MGRMARIRAKLRGEQPKKAGVLLALPALRGESHTTQVLCAVMAGAISARPDWPYYVEPYGLMYRSPVDAAMNGLVKHFMESDHEYLAIWDHDAIPPPNWYELIGRGDIVSGVTWMWDAERDPVKRLQFNQFRLNKRDQAITVVPTPDELSAESYEVDIVGTHCMVIHRRVFDKLGMRPFIEPAGPDGARLMSCDVYFCRAAKVAGFKVQIIPSVIFDHVKATGLKGVYEALVSMMHLGRRSGYAVGYQDAKAGNPSALDGQSSTLAPAPAIDPATVEASAEFVPEDEDGKESAA